MTNKHANKLFEDYWKIMVEGNEQLQNDKPAKRQEYSFFIDDLQRSGQISMKQASQFDL